MINAINLDISQLVDTILATMVFQAMVSETVLAFHPMAEMVSLTRLTADIDALLATNRDTADTRESLIMIVVLLSIRS